MDVDAIALGKKPANAKIANFIAYDTDETGVQYAGVIPVEKVIDPFGDDLEDFAILHFVEFTAKASYEAMYCNSYKADATFAANWKPPEAEPVPHRRFSLRQQGALLPRGQASLSPEGQALPSSAADAKGGDSQQGELELDQMEA